MKTVRLSSIYRQTLANSPLDYFKPISKYVKTKAADGTFGTFSAYFAFYYQLNRIKKAKPIWGVMSVWPRGRPHMNVRNLCGERVCPICLLWQFDTRVLRYAFETAFCFVATKGRQNGAF